jgi:hypothetical protein
LGWAASNQRGNDLLGLLRLGIGLRVDGSGLLPREIKLVQKVEHVVLA